MQIIEVFIFEIGTESGFLKNKYTTSQLVPCNEMLLDLNTLLKSFEEKNTPEAASCNNLMGSQIDKKYHCKRKCKTNKCIC